MFSILIEVKCPQHGFERFKIKIIKRFNIASKEIIPKFKEKPKRGEISVIYIGRNVSYTEIRNYLMDYFDKRGMIKEIVRMRMLT